jgi:FMN phosphatase YigB (HAD superfamily)
MKIGFDLDKVFINTPPLIPNAVINKFYKQRDNGVLLYRIPSRSEQLFRKAIHAPFLRQPIQANLAFLKELSNEKKHQLYLISSRFNFLKPETTRLVKKYQLDKIFDELYFNYDNKQPHEFKNEMLKKLKLDIFVDDDLSLVRYVAKNNPKTKFFWYDQQAKGKSVGDNIKAITNLGEILQ